MIDCTSGWRTTSASVKRMKPIPSTPSRIRTASTRPLRWPDGRSICVMSPVTTAFESKPRRVRNIFICSGVVFCASSRMTNESFSVRPRMNASGATSITPRSIQRWARSKSVMSWSAS
jgi:hypothetical protein